MTLLHFLQRILKVLPRTLSSAISIGSALIAFDLHERDSWDSFRAQRDGVQK